MRAMLLGLFSLIAAANSVAAQTTQTTQSGAIPQQVLQRAAQLRSEWAGKVARGVAPATATEPSITAGKILTPSIDVTKAPGVPSLQVTLESGTVGAEDIMIALQASNSSSAYQSGFYVAPYPPEPVSETVKFQLGGPFNLYSAPRAYNITGIYINAKDGQFIAYGPAQIASLFPTTTIQVTNSGTPDAVAPVASHGKILTPTVSLSSASPVFATKLAVSDDLSGVIGASISVSNASGQYAFYTESSIAYPVLKGKVISYTTLPSSTPTGTYTISGATVYDAAGNSFSATTTTDLQKLFGSTSFQVTN